MRVTKRTSQNTTRVGAVLALAVILIAAPAGAQNLVFNGDFDTNLDGWSSFNPYYVISYSTEDAAGDPASGSALGQIVSTEGLNECMDQCVSAGIAAGLQYRFAGTVKIPSNGPAGQTFVQLTWTSDPMCASGVLGTESLYFLEHDVWERINTFVTAPQGATAAIMCCKLIKNISDARNYVSSFDEIALEPVVFADGFDLGDMSAWSTAVD